MTALQDWLSNSIDPRTLKALICDTIRGSADDRQQVRSEPTLIRRGVERC